MLNFSLRYLVMALIILFNITAVAEEKLVALQIDVPYVELFSGPGIGYPVLHIVEKGETVNVLIKRTSWLKVQDKRGNIGWLPQASLFGLSQQGTQVEQREITNDDFILRNYEAGVMYGDLSGANYYDIYLAYNFSRVFNGQVSIGKGLGDISDSTLFEAMLVAQPLPNLLVVPYVGIGGGIIKTSPHSILADAQSRQSTLMSAAVGFKYYLARNFLLRAEYKYSLALTDRDDNEEIKVWKLGFSVFF
ncbi:MAG: SH3 domain-containing protein [Colwellia sp.]|nr:SH3 domain-containing protein [Colwellia sp.]